MKIKETTEAKIFNPITISFTIESERELELMWALSNNSYNGLSAFLNNNISQVEIEPFNSKDKEIVKFGDLYDVISKKINPKDKP